MKKFKRYLCVALITALPLHAIAGGGHDHGHGHGHEEHEDEPEKGPHRGRLLREDDFSVEVTIFEDGIPPQYRVFAYDDGEPIDPKDLQVTITLHRFGRGTDVFPLEPREDYLFSKTTVEEPHSFDVAVEAKYGGKENSWKYESYEGRTSLSDNALSVAGITVDTVGPQKISTNTEVFGRILPNEDRVAHLYPRFPGVIKEIRKKLGDAVEKGDVLAVVESNQSMQPYEVRSLIAGSVVKRHATLGEYVPEDKELFVVADLSEVWADFQVYRDDFGGIKVGQEISIQTAPEQKQIVAQVSYVSPLTDVTTQSKLIRAVISNKDASLRPGLFISGVLSSQASAVPIAVKREAIQTFRDWQVVYITDGHTFQAIPVETGKQDQRYVEITSGLKEGDRYVSKNSFVIKADVEKSGASHDH